MNLIVFFLLYSNYKSTGKVHFKFALWSLVIESTRQFPDFFIPFYPEQNYLYIFSIALQAAASLLFLLALMKARAVSKSLDRVLGFALLGLICTVAAFHGLTGLPDSALVWYAVYSPVLAISFAIIIYSKTHEDSSPVSRRILLSGSIVLFLLRVWLPAIEEFTLTEIVYYIEVLVFPLLAASLALAESEQAQNKIKELLSERNRTIKELQFVFDNSMDTILITNNVGLLLSWNNRAEEKFGYTSGQAVGKIHIDELFSNNYWHQNAIEKEEFAATMEAVDGSTFPVTARMQTVVDKDISRTIYVIQNKQPSTQG